MNIYLKKSDTGFVSLHRAQESLVVCESLSMREYSRSYLRLASKLATLRACCCLFAQALHSMPGLFFLKIAFFADMGPQFTQIFTISSFICENYSNQNGCLQGEII